MSINPLNDISKVYLEQVVESAVPGKPAERLGAVTAIPKSERDAARERALAKAKAMREKKGITKEALDPVGKEDADVDNDGKKNTKSDKYLLKRRQAISKAITHKEALDPVGKEDKDIDYDGDHDKTDKYLLNRRKVRNAVIAKEGYSNWRQDLSEVMSTTEKDENEQKIVEKKVKNKIKINPNIGEAVENLGGTLLEMVEVDDFEGVFDDLSDSDIFFLSDDLIEEVVEEFFAECLSEGYDIQEVENILLESLEISSSLLTEANVTYGHDTKIKKDRLEKVKTAVKNVGKKIVRGVGYAAGVAVRGAKAVGRELKAGYRRGRYGASGSSTSSDSGSSTSSDSGSSASSGSSQSSGSSTSSGSGSSGSSRPGLLGRIGSALKSGLKRVIAKGARKVARGAIGVARKMEKEKPSAVHSKSGVRSASTRRGIGGGKEVEVAGEPKKEQPVQKVSVRDVTPKKPKVRTGYPGKERAMLPPGKETKSTPVPVEPKSPETKSIPAAKTKTSKVTTSQSDASSSETKKPRPARRRRGGPSVEEVKAKIDKKEAEQNRKKETRKAANEILKSVAKEEVQINEKTLTSAETKEKERIVKSMKDKAVDFEKRYPGRGKEVMYATATKMAKKMAEQAMEIQPKTEPQPQTKEKPLNTTLDRQKYSNLKMLQQKKQQLERQRLNLQKQGKLPLETD